MNNIPIPEGAYDVIRSRYGIDRKQALTNFSREIIYQCRKSKGAPDIILAVVLSMENSMVTVHYRDDLYVLGYNDGNLTYSMHSANYVYRSPEMICEDGWDKYLSALHSTAQADDITAEKLNRDPLGLAFIYIISLYMERKRRPVTVPMEVRQRLEKSTDVKYKDGVLTFTSDSEDNLLDDLLMFDVIWYQHWVYENSAYTKTIVALDSGKKKELIGDYYPDMNIMNNCDLHLAVASEVTGVSPDDAHPELSIRIISKGGE